MKINLFDNGTIGDKIGGGFTFFRNFKTTLLELGHQITDKDYDVSIAIAANVVMPEEWETASKKPRVLRTDGIAESWRNRKDMFSRLKKYAHEADLVVYQSDFIANTIGRLLGKRHGIVIRNGVDTNVFNPNGPKYPEFGDPSLVFVNYRVSENKRFEEVIQRFREFKLDNPKATITFVGQYDKKIVFWNGKDYDFLGISQWKKGVDWEYFGVVENRNELAKILRSSKFFPYPSFNDPCPNALIEALCTGLVPMWICDYGSSKELVDLYNNGYDFSLEHMTKIYIEKINALIK